MGSFGVLGIGVGGGKELCRTYGARGWGAGDSQPFGLG